MTFLSRIYKEGIMIYWNVFREYRYFSTNQNVFRIILVIFFLLMLPSFLDLDSDESTQGFDIRFRNRAWTLVTELSGS